MSINNGEELQEPGPLHRMVVVKNPDGTVNWKKTLHLMRELNEVPTGLPESIDDSVRLAGGNQESPNHLSDQGKE
jgi:hypothetical protein